MILPLAVALQATVPQPASPVAGRIAEVVEVIRGGGRYDAVFGDAFRAQIPQAQFDAISTRLKATLGAPEMVETIDAVTPSAARFRLRFERGTADMEIAVDPTAPHRVTGLLVKGVTPRGTAVTTIDAVPGALAALPGQTGFALARLGDGAPVPLAQKDAARPFAIGSAFKLVILAELARSIAAGERRWSDVVTLDGSALPGGGYAQSPRGTRIALRDLAERMIAVSDNSATDILLFYLGRRRVEAMLPVVGMTDGAARNVPFLGALDLFKLKGVDGGALGRAYLAQEAAGRRALLEGRVAATPIAAIPRDLFQDGRPLSIDTIEWFASADDLIRTMDWLRRHSEGPDGATLRAILSKNPGLPEAAGDWRYIGYKGGSEPGVLSMTFLLQGKDGQWFALAAGWNDPAKDVDLLRFRALMGNAVALAAPK